MENALSVSGNLFVPASITPVTVETDHTGLPVAQITDSETVPVFDSAFDLILVNSIHAKKDKSLAPYIGEFFVANISEEGVKEKHLMPITVCERGFALFEAFNPKETNRPLCSSSNGLTPRVFDGVNTFSNRCALEEGPTEFKYLLRPVCPKAKWANGQKPECKLHYTLAMFDLDLRVPVKMTISGAAASSFRKAILSFSNTFNAARGKAFINGKQPPSPYEFMFVLKAVEADGDYVYADFSFKNACEEYGDITRYTGLNRLYLQTVFAPKQQNYEESYAQATGTDDYTSNSVYEQIPIDDTQPSELDDVPF